MSKIPYRFRAVYSERSEIDIWIEADSQEEAENTAIQGDFDWEEDTKNKEYLTRHCEKITLTEVDGEPTERTVI